MSDWGSSHFRSGNAVLPNELQELITEKFPPVLKQAMYAAASSQVIRQGTWDGCALNAAGEQIQATVSSTHTAAEKLGISQAVAERFISLWDARKGSEEENTEALKIMLLQAGLFRKPGKVVSVTVFRSAHVQTLDAETFEKMYGDDLPVFTDEAIQLLMSGPELVDA